jgi:hypothetical protein
MTEISYNASTSRNAQTIMDLVAELKRNYYSEVGPNASQLVEEIYWAANEIKDEAQRVEKLKTKREGNRHPDRQ